VKRLNGEWLMANLGKFSKLMLRVSADYFKSITIFMIQVPGLKLNKRKGIKESELKEKVLSERLPSYSSKIALSKLLKYIYIYSNERISKVWGKERFPFNAHWSW